MPSSLSPVAVSAFRAVKEAVANPNSLVRVTIASAEQIDVVNIVFALLEQLGVEDEAKTTKNCLGHVTVVEIVNGSAIEFVIEGEK